MLAAKNTRQNSRVIENGNEFEDARSSSSEIKLEKSQTKVLKQKKTRTKRGKKVVRPMIEVKEETVNEEITREMETNQDKNDNQLSSNVTLESVYEDAKSSVSVVIPVCFNCLSSSTLFSFRIATNKVPCSMFNICV